MGCVPQRTRLDKAPRKYPWIIQAQSANRGSRRASQRFYSAPLASTAISYLCSGKLHQAGLSKCVKMFMLAVFSLSGFARTDCSAHRSIRGRCPPDFLSIASVFRLTALLRRVNLGVGGTFILTFAQFLLQISSCTLGEARGSLLALPAWPLPRLGGGRAALASQAAVSFVAPAPSPNDSDSSPVQKIN